jgi:hypothetical protein
MSARLSGPPDRTPSPVAELRQCRAARYRCRCAGPCWPDSGVVRRNAELAQRKGAAKHLPRTLRRGASGAAPEGQHRRLLTSEDWKGHALAGLGLSSGYLEMIRNCGESVTPSHHSMNCAITLSVSCQLVTGTQGTPTANTG